MLNVGLTGGIASGKSTVTDIFRQKGAYVLDHDEIAHTAEEPGGAAWEEIVRAFGMDILNPDRTVSRKRLGEIVFRDPLLLEKLNQIVHPAVFREWMERIGRIGGEHPEAIIISDVPLLIETGWHRHVDSVLLIYIRPEEQIRRLMARNGLSRREAEERLNSQMSIDAKVPFADYVIDNEGPVEATRKQADRIWTILMEVEKKKRTGV
ncbi:MAG: dephospho-CoA kinase [Syntrophales bacterium]|nr:dephospho-CoA kinase [Syntrophales bacterium]MDD5234090.1 dephospho-CoA kinase [Syntrophales bacterium]MDD5532891.1 dephospho-CoA kinase [Syntrophales bacterium]